MRLIELQEENKLNKCMFIGIHGIFAHGSEIIISWTQDIITINLEVEFTCLFQKLSSTNRNKSLDHKNQW